MKPWTTVDRATTPDGQMLTLEEHDGDYAIRVAGAVLMTTRQHWSEEQAAELACAHVRGKAARVLVGGLGLGFTLRATLRLVGVDAGVIAAEMLAPVIAWNRLPSMPCAAAVADPRVTIVARDVAEIIRESAGAFDSIVLDVDNGPAALTVHGNRALYSLEGLRAAHTALRPNGCLSIWSAAPDAAFERSMQAVGFGVEARTVRARPGGGRRHTIFLGRKPAGAQRAS